MVSEKKIVRVKVYSPAGMLKGYIDPKNFSQDSEDMDLTVDAAGRIYVLDRAANQIKVFETR